MATMQDNNDDDSFIILGTSPGTSLDLKCDGLVNGHSLHKIQIEDAMNEFSMEASQALKAHFKLGDCPSSSSMMVASTIITEDQSTEELQKRFGELLDENILLKETLKHNNDSLKDQFLLIASCQEDMMKTHKLHKEKFDETKELVEKLRHENKKLKHDITRMSESEASSSDASKSGPSSGLEFVTSPDDDTINKLTAQLELVEKQRRQVIVDNEKLTWQKESLEHIVDATTKERDELKVKLHNVELQLSSKSSEHELEVQSLKDSLHSLNSQLQSANSFSSLSSEEIVKRDLMIRQLEGKVAPLQTELKAAQLKILDFENVKLEYSRQKSGLSDTVKMYKEQIQELKTKLKEAQTVVFQPVRVSVTPGREPSSSDHVNFTNSVKLYDKTLKHLAEHLNAVSNGLADNLVELMGVVASLYDFKLERTTAEQFKSGLADVKKQLEKQHSNALNNIGHVRGTLSIFDGIFRDYSELLRKTQHTAIQSSPNVETLTAALLARGQELQAMGDEIKQLKTQKEDVELLKAQVDLYKCDFMAERECREKMASEKDAICAELRSAHRRIQDLSNMLEEVRKDETRARRTSSQSSSTPPRTTATNTTPNRNTNTPAKSVYTCPKCMRFKSPDLHAVDDHLDYCVGLDDHPCNPV